MIYGRELPGCPYDLKARLTRCIIKGQRMVFSQWLSSFSGHAPLKVECTEQEAQDVIRQALDSDHPCMIARFGAGEIEAVLRGMDIQDPGSAWAKIGRMCIGRSGPFWWDNSIRAGLVWNAGYFPETDVAIQRFSNRALEDARQLDILASWLAGEKRIAKRYCPNVRGVPLGGLNSFSFDRPWSKGLEGRKVLIVHPFVDTIRQQYSRRKDIFRDPDVLPEFDLQTYRSVSSFAGIKTGYRDWFEALEKMESDIAKLDFDVALIGCGAYGFSLAAFVKRDLGRKAVHLGGVTQVLFGIKGRRWESFKGFAERFYNESWVRPLPSDIAGGAVSTIEGGCYW